MVLPFPLTSMHLLRPWRPSLTLLPGFPHWFNTCHKISRKPALPPKSWGFVSWTLSVDILFLGETHLWHNLHCICNYFYSPKDTEVLCWFSHHRTRTWVHGKVLLWNLKMWSQWWCDVTCRYTPKPDIKRGADLLCKAFKYLKVRQLWPSYQLWQPLYSILSWAIL